jgi:hypothetical protein
VRWPRISRQTKSANLQTYAYTVIEAIGDRTDVVVDSGHCVALSHPKELAERLAST